MQTLYEISGEYFPLRDEYKSAFNSDRTNYYTLHHLLYRNILSLGGLKDLR